MGNVTVPCVGPITTAARKGVTVEPSKDLYVYDYKLPKEVIELADKELKRKEFCARYHLLGSNCEHFATLCETGMAFSMSVDGEDGYKVV